MASNSMLGPPYPPRPAPRPRRVDAFELFPVAYLTTKLVPTVLNDPRRFGIDPDSFVWPELLFVFRDNVVKNSYAPEKVVDGLRKIPFIVALNVDLDETANSLADLVLPELHHLEKLAEKLLFGTDWPAPMVQSIGGNVAAVLQLPLSAATCKSLLVGNAERLFGW